MAELKQKNFHADRRAIEGVIEDDFGHIHIVGMHAGHDRCTSCGREYPRTEGEVDFDALIAQVCSELAAETDKVIGLFEKHGADVSKAKAVRDARSKRSPGNAGGDPAAGGGDRAG